MLLVLEHDPLHQLPDLSHGQGSKHKATDRPVPSKEAWSSITATALRAKELLHYTSQGWTGSQKLPRPSSPELVTMHQEELDQQTIYGRPTLTRLQDFLLKVLDRLLRGTPCALQDQHTMIQVHILIQLH